MNYRFSVEFMEDAATFLEKIEPKAREKILYNIWKARTINDTDLFKKLNGTIWEFRALYNGICYRLFAFWNKTEKDDSVVISTHGFVKKTNKTPKGEIEKAEALMRLYLKNKNK